MYLKNLDGLCDTHCACWFTSNRMRLRKSMYQGIGLESFFLTLPLAAISGVSYSGRSLRGPGSRADLTLPFVRPPIKNLAPRRWILQILHRIRCHVFRMRDVVIAYRHPTSKRISKVLPHQYTIRSVKKSKGFSPLLQAADINKFLLRSYTLITIAVDIPLQAYVLHAQVPNQNSPQPHIRWREST